MDLQEQPPALCGLALLAGREELCPRAECPLWEDGGCALERMSADDELYVDGWPTDDAVDVK